MASTYTTNLGIEKIGTGEQSGTWGDTTNTNFDILDEAVNGIISITLSSAGSSGSPTALPITDGASSNGRNKFIEFVDGGDLGGTAYVQLTPNDAEKIVHIRNSLSSSRSVIVFQGTYNASNDFEIVNGADVLLKFNGGGSGATVTDVNVDLTVTGATIATADINGGAIDGTVIGAASAAAITATTITGTTITASTAAVPDASDGATLGSASLEWSDLYLADGAVVFFGDDQDITLTHVADTGLTLKHANTGDDKFPTFLLATGDTDIAADDKLGVINFQAPDEGAGTDAILVAAGIEAVSEGDFSASSNATSLVFKTGASEAAAEKFRVTSAGNVGIGTDSPADLLHIKSTSADAEISLESTNSGGDARIRLIGNSSGSSTVQFQDEGDSNIGFISYLHSDNAMTFRTNDSERMRIDSSGNVGIGLTDADEKLEVFGDVKIGQSGDSGVLHFGNTSDQTKIIGRGSSHSSLADTMDFYTDENVRVRINSSGNVGIGTTSPDQLLHLKKDTAPHIRFERNDTSVGNGSSIGQIDFEHQESGNAGTCAKFGVVSGDTDGRGEFLFQTGLAGTLTEKVRIDKDGSVGIGTSSPSFPLDIRDTTGDAVLRVLHSGTASTDDSQVRIQINGTTATSSVFFGDGDDSDVGKILYSHNDNGMRFTTNASEAMRINSGGHLLLAKTTSGVNTAGVELTDSGQMFATSANAIAGYFNRQGATGTVNLVEFRVSDSDAGKIKSSAGGTPVFAAASDERLKDNITDHESELSSLMALRPVRWDWKDKEKGAGEGFVAQELEQTAWADLVSEDEDGYKMVSGLGAVETRLIKALQEAVTRIETLEAEVAALKGA